MALLLSVTSRVLPAAPIASRSQHSVKQTDGNKEQCFMIRVVEVLVQVAQRGGGCSAHGGTQGETDGALSTSLRCGCANSNPIQAIL